VADAFKQVDPKLQPTIKSDDEIHLTMAAGPITVFLDRTRAECQRRPKNCDATIKQLVSATTATTGSMDALKFTPEAIYPVVRPASSLQALQATIGSAVDRLIVSKPYVSGAVLLYAIDSPQALRFVSKGDLDQAGLTLDALDKLARSHVSRLPHVEFQQMQGAPGLWAAIAHDGYGTSRLFDPKFWDEIEVRAGGPVALALPTRDWILAARLSDAQSVTQLRTVAARIVAGEPTGVTPALVRRNGESWIEVPP